MGIQGLLPFLKKASRAVNLRDFKGQTVAVDAYCWLHKGAFSCADKLVRGEPTDGYVLYVMKQVNQLLSYDIKPILVFDGCHLPSKAITEKKRRENREKNRKKAKELLREGKAKEARECFQRCVDITSEMAADTIRACRARNIDVIVAPYEADSQLAYLNLSGVAQLIITEDSDLILFGCKKGHPESSRSSSSSSDGKCPRRLSTFLRNQKLMGITGMGQGAVHGSQSDNRKNPFPTP
ncbi:Exonuclease 1 [Penaeus vannamei]|uniref:Exonuclease 1 n=1 Tax=Penaeus vannamei TaxID=6689 RepID=A0A3R7Q8X7_PENVA|nr:Exonuclease 1 [Penaeus vannamei]